MAKDRDDLDTEIEQEDADRGMPSISKNRKTGKASGIGQKIVAVIIGIIVILALIAVNGGFKGSEEDKPPKLTGNTSVANRLGPPPSLPPPPPAPPNTETPKEDRMLNTGQIAPPPPSSASGSMNRHQTNASGQALFWRLAVFLNLNSPDKKQVMASPFKWPVRYRRVIAHYLKLTALIVFLTGLKVLRLAVAGQAC